MPAAPTDYIAKVGQEEKMLRKVTLPSTLIFSAKDVCTVSFYLYLYLKPREKCFFFRRRVTWSWHNIQRSNGCCSCFLGCEANSWRRRASSNPGDKVCVSFFSFFPFLVNSFSIFHDQTHTRSKTRKVRSDAGRPKGDREISVVARGRPLRGQTRLAPLQRGRLVASLIMMLCTDFLKL